MTQGRLCPRLPLPAYRYVPGQGPKDEKRDDIPKIKIENLPPERWKENEAYLYGIDLYHHGYFYEAHEVWEELWHKVGRKTATGHFLKALIQCAAVQLKIGLGETSPAERMLKRIQELFETVVQSPICRDQKDFMGMNLSNLIEELQSRHSPPSQLLQ